MDTPTSEANDFKQLIDETELLRLTKSRPTRCTGQVACVGEKRDIYKILVGKPEPLLLSG
jgi:hypothetical protein